MKLANRRRRRPGRSRRRRRKSSGIKKILFCTIVEILVMLSLVIMVGWNKGVKDWFIQFKGSLSKPVVKEVDITGINSPYGILIDAKSGKVLGQLNADERIYPASLTKMMTAIVAIEELKSLKTEITLSNEVFNGLYEQDASMAGFQPGETVKAIDLIYGVMLPSGAECCIGLADYISGSEAAFVELMNQKAAKIGMSGTHFMDSTGLHNPEHYSTVRDMATLLKYCIKNSTFREVIKSALHSTGPTNVHPDGITYHSTLFKNLSDKAVTGGEILGGKTGFTNAAGLCLASFAEIEDREYIFVSAGAPDSSSAPHIVDAITVYNRVGVTASAS